MKQTNFTIIVSKRDQAGLNIAKNLEKLNIKVNYFDKDSINLENIDKKIHTDFIIFATKHQGKKQNMLSLHAPGNWNKADFGGKPNQICNTSALVLKHFFKILNKNKKNYEATLEVTHHGPFIETPCLFIEIGGTEKDWQDKKAGEIIAKTIQEAINSNLEKYESSIAVGGPHYCPNFNKIQLNSKYAISHIIPQYAFPIKRQMLEQAIKKTKEKISFIIIDWKGLKSQERQETIKLCDELGLGVKRTSEIEKD